MKRLLVTIFFVAFACSPLLAFAEAGQTPATYGAATNPNSPDACAVNGQTFSSQANNGAGGCIAPLPPVVNVSLGYSPLEPLPFVNYAGFQSGQVNFCSLLNGLFRLLIFIGGLLAVGSFVYAGVMYMTSEVVGTKSKAKEGVQASVWGLLILLASYIILNTINPQLLSCNQALNPVSGYQFVTPSTPAPTNCTNGVGTGCLTADQQAAFNKIAEQQQGGAQVSQTDLNNALQAQTDQEAKCTFNGGLNNGVVLPPGWMSTNNCTNAGYKTCTVIATAGTGNPYRCGIPK